MSVHSCRIAAALGVAASLFAAVSPVIAAETESPDALIALTLEDAGARAVERQPQLEAYVAEARGARRRATAAGELPDPSLTFGITDLTLEGRDRFTLEHESDTQISAGIRQAFPRVDKRRLQRERAEQEAETFDAEHLAAERRVVREAGLAWLDAWKAEEARSIARRGLAVAERQADAARIAYEASLGSQSDLLAAQVEAASLRDRVAGFEQEARHARNQLARWIGPVAFNPLCPDLPAETPPDTEGLIAALATHPHFLAEAKRLATSRTDVDLARQDYRPDWALTVGYGHRPEFADYGQLQVEIPLPVFTGNRQDQRLQSAIEMQDAQASRLEDALREHRAEIRLNADDWQLLQERLARYDRELLPQANARVAAALAAYGAGSGALRDVLDARRKVLDIEMQRLELRTDSARHQVQLHYFAP